jgi:hypothetical protein
VSFAVSYNTLPAAEKAQCIPFSPLPARDRGRGEGAWCTADCCKEGAFQITEGSIAHWLEQERIDRARDIAQEIARIQADLLSCTGLIFLAARGLESSWGADTFRAFWGRFEVAFTRAVEARAKAEA